MNPEEPGVTSGVSPKDSLDAVHFRYQRDSAGGDVVLAET